MRTQISETVQMTTSQSVSTGCNQSSSSSMECEPDKLKSSDFVPEVALAVNSGTNLVILSPQ